MPLVIKKNKQTDFSADNKTALFGANRRKPLASSPVTDESQIKPDAISGAAPGVKPKVNPNNILTDVYKKSYTPVAKPEKEVKPIDPIKQKKGAGTLQKLGSAAMAGITGAATGTQKTIQLWNELNRKYNPIDLIFGKIFPEEVEKQRKLDQDYLKELESTQEGYREKYMTDSTPTEQFIGQGVEAVSAMIPQVVLSLAGGGAGATANAIDMVTKSAVPGLTKGAVSNFGNRLVEMIPFMTQAGGQYAREAENKGATIEQQLMYGLAGGLAEGITEMVPMGALKKALGVGDDVAKNAVKKGTNNLLKKFGQKGWQWIVNAGEQMGQEVAVNPLVGIAEKGIIDPDKPVVGEGGIIDPAEAVESGKGALGMSLVMTALGLPANAASHVMASKIVESGKPMTKEQVDELNNAVKADIEKQSIEPEIGQETNLNTDEIQPISTEQEADRVITPEENTIDSEGLQGQIESEKEPGAEQKPEAQGRPEYEQKPQAQGVPITDRTVYNVGDRKTNAYQFDNPEVKPYFQEYAQYILDNEFVPNANLDRTTDVMEKLKSETLLYPKQIKDALERLVRNEGQENVAAAKKVELVIDDMLTNGFDSVLGETIPPIEDYIKIKSRLEGKEITPIEKFNIDEIPIPESPYAESAERGGNNVLQNKDGENITGDNRSTEVQDGNDAKAVALSKALRYFNRDGNSGINAEVDTRTTLEQKQIQRLMNELGVNVVFYKSDSKLPVDGVFDPELKDTVFIRSADKRNMMWAVGHEFFHSLKVNHPDIYEIVISIYKDSITTEQKAKYIEGFDHIPEYQEELLQDENKLIEEMLADEAGNTFTDKTFWERVYDRSVELFERLIAIARDFFENLKALKYTNYLEKEQIARFENDFEQIVSAVRARVEEGKTTEQAEGQLESVSMASRGKQERENETIVLPSGDSGFEIYKNPTDEQYFSLLDKFDKEYPNAPKGEPKVRRTYDEDGNEYVWMSGDGMHERVESYLKNSRGIRANQNRFFDDINLSGREKDERALSIKVNAEYDERVSTEEPEDIRKNYKGEFHTVSKTKDNKFDVGEFINKFYDRAFDTLQELNRFGKRYGQKPNEGLYAKALASKMADKQARIIATKRMIDAQGNTIGKSLKDVLSPLNKDKELMSLFDDYLVYVHAPSWMSKDRTVFAKDLNLTIEDVQNRRQEIEAEHPEFIQMQKELVEFQRQLAKAWLVDTGVLSQEAFNKFVKEYPDYVPLMRSFKEAEKKGGYRPKSGYVNQSNPVKKAKGSERDIISPIESILEHIGQYTKVAKRNEAGQAFLEIIRSNREDLEDVARELWPEIIWQGGLGNEIKAQILDSDGNVVDNIYFEKVLEEDGLDGVIESFNMLYQFKDTAKRDNKGKTVTVLENGKPVHVEIFDESLLDALLAITPKQQRGIINGLRAVTSVMKNLTTGLNLSFGIARNIWRDLVTGYVSSKSVNANPLLYFRYIAEITAALGDVLAAGIENKLGENTLGKFINNAAEKYRLYENMGGGAFASPISADINQLKRAKEEVLGKRHVGNFIMNVLETINNSLETAPRLAEFKRIVEQAGNNYENRSKAIYEANDLTVNFSRFGDDVKAIDSFTPFLNAAMQGIDKTVRIYKDNPIGAILKSIWAVTIPSIIFFMINNRDDETKEAYRMLNNYTKDNYFVIAYKDSEGVKFFKIPKPREIGMVFGAVPERILRLYMDNDPEAFKQYADNFLNNLIPPNPVTENIAFPAVRSLAMGKNWRFNDLETYAERMESPKYRYNETTSGVAKFIGDKLNVSPKRLDDFFRSYFGGLAQYGIPLTSEKGGSVKKTFVSQVTADPVYSTDALNSFYDLRNKLTAKYRDQKSGNYIMTGVEYGLYKQFNKVADILSKYRKAANGTNSADKKRELRKEMNKLALEIYEQAKSMLEEQGGK